MLYHVANILCLVTGLILFGLAVFGLMDVPQADSTLLSVILQPSGYSPLLDQVYLGVIGLLGFWLTLRIHVRVPAAIALGLILGKMILVQASGTLGIVVTVGLSLIVVAALVRLVSGGDTLHGDGAPGKPRFW